MKKKLLKVFLDDKILTYLLEGVVIVLLALLIVLAFAQVVLRYAFNSPLTWSEEVARSLMIYLTFIGSALALKKNLHLHMGFSLHSLLKKTITFSKGWIDLFINLFIGTFALLLLVKGIQLTIKLWSVRLGSIPVSWGYTYMILPLSSALMLKFCVSSIISAIQTIKQDKENNK